MATIMCEQHHRQPFKRRDTTAAVVRAADTPNKHDADHSENFAAHEGAPGCRSGPGLQSACRATCPYIPNVACPWHHLTV
jgi:hypothetical protein